ncbi:hypothetical protein BDW71DRAFT_189078 [Aspergillus fruticulosus]
MLLNGGKRSCSIEESTRNPIVVFTQGSVHDNPRNLIRPTIEALKEEDDIPITTLIGLLVKWSVLQKISWLQSSFR